MQPATIGEFLKHHQKATMGHNAINAINGIRKH